MRVLKRMRACWAQVVVIMTCVMPHVAAAQSSDSLRIPVRPRVDTLVISQAGTVVGGRVTTWTRLGLDQLFVHAERNTRDGAWTVDSTFSDPRTLRPSRSVRYSGDSVVAVLFGHDTIFVTTIIAGRSSTAWAVAPAAELFASTSLDALAASMPLSAGATRRVLVFFAPPSSYNIQGVQLRVEAREELRGRSVWRVIATTPGGGSIYWLDDKTRTTLRSSSRDGDRVIALRP
jgi:hypothetical protein